MIQPVYHTEANAVLFLPIGCTAAGALAGPGRVFVCGSLQDPAKMNGILGRESPFAPAFVLGYRHVKEDIDGKIILLMIAAPGEKDSVLPGVVWLNLTETDLRAIEAIELAGGYRKAARIPVRVGSRTIEAMTFIKR